MLLYFVLTSICIKNQYRIQYTQDNSHLISSPSVLASIYSTKDVIKPIRCINRVKWTFNRVAYYSNTTASRQLLLICEDVERNPGWQDNVLRTNTKDYLQNFAKGMSHCQNVQFLSYECKCVYANRLLSRVAKHRTRHKNLHNYSRFK